MNFPIGHRNISRYVGAPAVLFTAAFYIKEIINGPPERTFSIGLTIFGVSVALAGLCFSVNPATREAKIRNALKFCGEKFMHAALFAIQIIMILFARDSILGIGLVADCRPASLIVTIVLTVPAAAMAGYGLATWYFGFERLNEELWENWAERIAGLEETNREAEDE